MFGCNFIGPTQSGKQNILHPKPNLCIYSKLKFSIKIERPPPFCNYRTASAASAALYSSSAIKLAQLKPIRNGHNWSN